MIEIVPKNKEHYKFKVPTTQKQKLSYYSPNVLSYEETYSPIPEFRFPNIQQIKQISQDLLEAVNRFQAYPLPHSILDFFISTKSLYDQIPKYLHNSRVINEQRTLNTKIDKKKVVECQKFQSIAKYYVKKSISLLSKLETEIDLMIVSSMNGLHDRISNFFMYIDGGHIYEIPVQKIFRKAEKIIEQSRAETGFSFPDIINEHLMEIHRYIASFNTRNLNKKYTKIKLIINDILQLVNDSQYTLDEASGIKELLTEFEAAIQVNEKPLVVTEDTEDQTFEAEDPTVKSIETLSSTLGVNKITVDGYTLLKETVDNLKMQFQQKNEKISELERDIAAWKHANSKEAISLRFKEVRKLREEIKKRHTLSDKEIIMELSKDFVGMHLKTVDTYEQLLEQIRKLTESREDSLRERAAELVEAEFNNVNTDGKTTLELVKILSNSLKEKYSLKKAFKALGINPKGETLYDQVKNLDSALDGFTGSNEMEKLLFKDSLNNTDIQIKKVRDLLSQIELQKKRKLELEEAIFEVNSCIPKFDKMTTIIKSEPTGKEETKIIKEFEEASKDLMSTIVAGAEGTKLINTLNGIMTTTMYSAISKKMNEHEDDENSAISGLFDENIALRDKAEEYTNALEDLMQTVVELNQTEIIDSETYQSAMDLINKNCTNEAF